MAVATVTVPVAAGGVLYTNPIGATGLIRVGEVALQVSGRAGDRQIPGAKTALSHAIGEMDQLNSIMIVSSELWEGGLTDGKTGIKNCGRGSFLALQVDDGPSRYQIS